MTGVEWLRTTPWSTVTPPLGLGATPHPVPVATKEDMVATLDTELLLVGLPGRAGANEDGDAGKPADGCFCIGCALGVPDIGIDAEVGVGVGVEWLEPATWAVLMGLGV
jgi:hypothetical protein